jgi:hypothetical protein
MLERVIEQEDVGPRAGDQRVRGTRPVGRDSDPNAAAGEERGFIAR